MDFEIVNPDLYLATLSGKNARLSVEMDIELGMGYQTAGGSDNLPIGTIPVDAIFTPCARSILPPSRCIWAGKPAWRN